MNEALREYERKLDQIDMEKKEFEREVKKVSLLWLRLFGCSLWKKKHI